MQRELSELSLEELWKLFPIRLAEHQECWAGWYRDEKQWLETVLPQELLVGIHHIGSTAVAGMRAKPTVDILVEVSDETAMKKAQEILIGWDYICMAQSRNRVSLNKGYTPAGFAERVFHIHLRLPGDTDEIFFRDYLRDHPEEAKAYETLKLRLWRDFEYDRDAYTDAKTEFVVKRTRLAKEEHEKRSGHGKTPPG